MMNVPKYNDITSECQAVYVEWTDETGKRFELRLGAFLQVLMERIARLEAKIGRDGRD